MSVTYRGRFKQASFLEYDKQDSFRHNLAATGSLIGAPVLNRFTNDVYLFELDLLRKISEPWKGDTRRSILDQLEGAAKRQNVLIHKPNISPAGPYYTWRLPDSDPLAKSNNEMIDKLYAEAVAEGRQAKGGKPKGLITNLTNNYTTGILSHELGHSRQNHRSITDALLRRNIPELGRYGGMIGAGIFEGERESLAAALLGTGLQYPLLQSEIGASIKGKNILSDAHKAVGKGKLSLRGKLAPFAGVPTYLNLAALPLSTYGIRKAMGGFREPTVGERIDMAIKKLRNR